MDKIFFFALVGGCCGSSSVCVRVFVSACFSCLVERKKKQKKKDELHDVRMSVCVCVCVSSQTANRAAHKSVPSLPYVSRSREMFVVPEI